MEHQLHEGELELEGAGLITKKDYNRVSKLVLLPFCPPDWRRARRCRSSHQRSSRFEKRTRRLRAPTSPFPRVWPAASLTRWPSALGALACSVAVRARILPAASARFARPSKLLLLPLLGLCNPLKRANRSKLFILNIKIRIY